MTTLDLRTLPPEQLSVIERLALLPEDERKAIYARLTEEQARAMRYEWACWARPDQLPPPEPWSLWIVCQGRASGKSRTLTEWMRATFPGLTATVLIGRNPREVRDVLIEGRSGILTICPPQERPEYEPSKLLLSWPSGAVTYIRSAEDPEGVRGLSVEAAVCDEFAHWAYPRRTWDNLRFALREGERPQTLIGTTPQPFLLFKELLGYPLNKPPKVPGTCIAPRVSTYRNAANLAPDYLAEMVANYEGTRIGRQELHAEILEDVEGALLRLATIDENRIEPTLDTPDPLADLLPRLVRRAVAVDPSWGRTNNEVGIVVGGVDDRRHGYTIADHSGRMEPIEWGRRMVWAYHHYGADVLLAETNFQAAQVQMVLKAVLAEDPRPVNFKAVTVSRGKWLRAEPVAGLHQQGRWHYVGRFPDLEMQWTEWCPGTEPDGWSPDRLDADVFLADELLLKGGPSAIRHSAGEMLPKPALGGRGRFG